MGDNNAFRDILKKRIYNWTVQLTIHLRSISKKDSRFTESIIIQLLRSGTSVGANYVEAIGAPTTKDFRRFLSYALKSCNESKYWLALIRDTHIDESKKHNDLLQEAIELANILGKSVSTLYKQ
ncbi:MAG: four helix bundle protein [Candidatus Magasanikbacteria bacterium]|jgi:four helix bundle protein|nr:four helix bundle protein [Candidatus Magasanikbacteria bacterium]MBT4071597.1 four helix bundle protein [Candidatus Magasanikbacteria bacterium]